MKEKLNWQKKKYNLEIDQEISRIYKRFIKEHGEQYVNIPFAMRDEMTMGYDSNFWRHYPSSLKHAFFDDACLECGSLLQTSPTFTRYKHSKEFKELKAKMESKKYKGKGKWGTVRRFEDIAAKKKLAQIRHKIKLSANNHHNKAKLPEEIEKIIKD